MSDDVLWIVVSLGDALYGLPAELVDSMVLLPPTSEVPNTPDHVRGIFVLRDRAVPVLDLRLRLGMRSLAEETEQLLDLLHAREQDHLAWVNELEAAVQQAREFKLTTDPHACAFGKWYDTYETNNLLVAGLLKKFDAPHRRIHAIADEALEMERSGDIQGAKDLIASTRSGDLQELVVLFDRLRTQIQESLREIAVVITKNGRPHAFAVDAVETVSVLSEIDHDSVSDLFGHIDDEVVTSIRRLDKTGQVVICLSPERILT